MNTPRDRIIQATGRLLELQGYHATGLNQIIEESGSPKGSLYHYFPGGKEELAAESVRRVGRAVLERIKENLAAIDDPAESVEAFINAIAFDMEQSGFRAGGPITTVALETASSSERLRRECHNIYARWQLAFADKLVSGGVEEKRARRLAQVIVASIEGGIILCRTERSRTPLETVAGAMAELIRCCAT
ncbi:MAG TPA: TetR/AcrR family transcriptional regulator [Spirillospora sp.]|nr:TetR/AcrR family transcriptional regulator [Spirillospora sp.]